MNLIIRHLKVLVFFGIVWFASAQTSGQPAIRKPTDQFTLVAIEVAGNKHYTQNQIAALTGLRIGQSVSADGKSVNEEVFREAANRVGSTGAFSDITFRYEYSPKGTRFYLQVSESERFLAARFDNFVWFSDEDLTVQLRQRVPLFDGALPVTGTITDQVGKALQEMLAERKLPGTVEFLPTAKANGGPIEAVTYKVSGVAIHVNNVEFPGAGASENPLLKTVAMPLIGQDYSRSMLTAQERFNFMPIYLHRGYLKARFADSQAFVVESQNPNLILVDVTCPVIPNRQYKVGEVRWMGNTVFQSAELQPLTHLREGEPVDAVQLDEDLGALKKLYSGRGYLTAQVAASPNFDDDSSVVRYVIQLREGDMYRMGNLDIQGLDFSATQALTRIWKMRAGDPYDGNYLKHDFFAAITNARVSLPTNLKVSSQETPDTAKKIVNVTLVFAAKN